MRLMRQLEQVIPESIMQEMELPDAIREIEISGRNSSFDFVEFVKMMRKGHDTRLRKRVEKEADAVAATGYSNAEVRDFRKIFIQYDPTGSDRMPFEEFKRLLERITPLNPKLTGELRSIWNKCLKGYGQREDNSSDFPDFLRVMKECLARDFANMRSGTTNVHRRPSRAVLLQQSSIHSEAVTDHSDSAAT